MATIMELNLTLPFDVHGQLWHLLPTGRFTVSVTTRDSQRPTIKVIIFQSNTFAVKSAVIIANPFI
jgi:hypothetical protein